MVQSLINAMEKNGRYCPKMTFFKNLVIIHFFTKLVANWWARGTTSPKYTGAIQNLISVLGNHPSEFEKRLFLEMHIF